MRKVWISILCVFIASGCGNHTPSSADGVLDQLDAELANKSAYDSLKEERISGLRDSLSAAEDAAGRYELTRALYEQYSSYKSDSAYAYAGRMLESASTTDQQAEAWCAQVFCLLSTGYFKEAFEASEKIPVRGISTETRIKRYTTLIRLNYSTADYNSVQPYHDAYIDAGHRLSDSLLTLLPQDSPQWHYYHANQSMKAGRRDESILEFTPLAESSGVDAHTKAIIASCIGWMYLETGREDLAEKYIAQAAIYDLQTSTKEATALRVLSEMLSSKGEISRPAVYVRHSLDDANFYDSKLRKLQTGSILPVIEQNRFDTLSRKKNLLIAGILLATLILLAAVAVMWFIRRQNKRLASARNTIEERNRQLEEANEIKAEYIGNSFYQNSEYIEKLSQLYKTVDRMIVARQLDELRRSMKESALGQERDRMFDSFDSTFLKIFPSFIADYNALFPEGERRIPAKGLTTEMRIFALIRLGISESDRIAKFLDLSVHTVNTYKTRVKNKSLIENDRFEAEIMKTGRH